MKIRLVLRPLLCLLVVTGQGCGTTPDSKFYRLNALPQNQIAEPISGGKRAVSVKVGPLTIPDMLDQSQIVTSTGSNELQLAEFHRWAGDLRCEFQRVLGENISILLPTQQIILDQEFTKLAIDFQLFVNVREFTGKLGGTVTLNVDWTLVHQEMDKHQNMTAKKSVLAEQTDSADYSAFVAALSRLLARFSGEVVDEIRFKMAHSTTVPDSQTSQ